MNNDQEQEHNDYYYDSPYAQAKRQAEIDAIEKNDDRPWILTDFDTWVRNPNYNGPPNPPHPDDFMH